MLMKKVKGPLEIRFLIQSNKYHTENHMAKIKITIKMTEPFQRI